MRNGQGAHIVMRHKGRQKSRGRAMTRLIKGLAAALLTTASAACAPMTVSSHVERGLDLTRYHTFEWGMADALPQGDPRLDRNHATITHRLEIDTTASARYCPTLDCDPPLAGFEAGTVI